MSFTEVDCNNTFEWKIDDISVNTTKVSNDLAIDGNNFFLCVGYHLYNLQINGVCQFRLYPIGSWFLPFSYTFSIVDREGKEYVTLKGEILKSEKRLLMILDYGDLRKRDVIGGDSITVRFTMKREPHPQETEAKALNVADGTTDTNSCVTKDSSTNTDGVDTSLLETLSNDFSAFYENKTDTDCVLKVSDDQFNVHRAVLSARSSVFSAMFHHDTAENRTGEVNIPDVKATALSDVLYYVYSGKIRGLTTDTATSMYIVADKYDLPELRTKCLEFLKCNLTMDNFCDVAILAHTHGEMELEERVVWFIEEKLDEVLESSTWQQFSKDKTLLANKLLTRGFKAAKKKLSRNSTSK